MVFLMFCKEKIHKDIQKTRLNFSYGLILQKSRSLEKSFELNTIIHGLLRKFPDHERFALTDQMRKSALSIVSNITE